LNFHLHSQVLISTHLTLIHVHQDQNLCYRCDGQVENIPLGDHSSDLFIFKIGYIGGSVVARLLEHPDSTTFEITAMVRSAAKAAKLETLGLKTVIGSYSDLDQLELLTSEADVVFSMVDDSQVGII
jgi:hypothetical protein